MESNEEKWRDIEKAEDIKPKSNNPLVEVLRLHGIPYERIHGKKCSVDDFAKDAFTKEQVKERFKGYVIVIYGVLSDEGLPQPPLLWQIRGKEYDCWQIQINSKKHHGWVEATFDTDPIGNYVYVVQTMWGILDDVGKYRKHIFEDLMEGMELLLIVTEYLKDEERGGDTTPPEQRRSDEQLKQFVITVDELLDSFWKNIKAFYREQPATYQSNKEKWLIDIKTHPDMDPLLRKYKVTDELLLRVLDSSLSDRDKEPRALACYHAARILDYPGNLSVETLRKDYGDYVKRPK
jgi:hypothetical protein